MAAKPITDDAWMERCYVSICKEGATGVGGTEMHFQALTDSVNIEPGEKDIEPIPLVNGGRVTKFTPEKETTITLEIYPKEVGTDTGATGKGFFDLMHTADASVPIRVENTFDRNKYRILVLWTNIPIASITGAEMATTVTDTYAGVRFGMAEAYFTSVKVDFTDKIQKWTIIAKCSAFDNSQIPGSITLATTGSNVLWQSATGSTDALAAIGAYSTTNKFGATP